MATIKVNDIDLYYEEHGDAAADTVLLIMGFSMNAGAWAPQIDALKARYHVIAFDNRGAGRSSQPAGSYSMAQFTSDTAALLDAVGAGPVHVMGASMGGMIAQEFTLRYPERVRSLTLLCTTPGGPHSAGYEQMRENARLLDEVTDLQASMTPERALEFAQQLFTPEFLAAPSAGLMQMAGSTAQFPSTLEGLKGQMAAILAHDTYERLPQIAVPTLVMAGDADPMIDPANSRILAERIPNARLRLFEGQRHGFTAEKPDEVNAEIVAFLAERSEKAA